MSTPRSTALGIFAALGALAVLAACGPKPPWAEPVPLTAPVKRLVLRIEPEVAVTGGGVARARDADNDLRGRAWTSLAEAVRHRGFDVEAGSERAAHVVARLSLTYALGHGDDLEVRARLQLVTPEGNPIDAIDAVDEASAGSVTGRVADMLANLATRSNPLLTYAQDRQRSAQAAAEIEAPLSLALPAGTAQQRALFLDLGAIGDVPPRVATIATQILIARLDAVEGLAVIATADVEAMLQTERSKELLGCEQVRCYAELGGALGTDLVIYGELGRLGSTFNLALTVIDTAAAEVRARIGSTVSADEDVLRAELPRVARALVERLNGS